MPEGELSFDFGKADEPGPGTQADHLWGTTGPPWLIALLGFILALLGAGLAIWSFPGAIIGYVLAVGGLVLGALFRLRNDQLWANDKNYSPVAGTKSLAYGLMLVAFASTVASAVIVALDLARRYSLVLLVAVSFVGLIGLSPTRAAAQDPALESQTEEVYSRFSQCLDDGRPGLAAILMDESGSLQETDPDNRRVGSIQATMQELDVLRRRVGEQVKFEVTLAGFSGRYEERIGWREFDNESRVEILNEADEFANRNTGQETDYFIALDGVAESIVQRTAELVATDETQPCSILFWVTDGLHDIAQQPAGVAEELAFKPYADDLDLRIPGNELLVEQRGIDLLCEPGGVIDQLRAEGVAQVAVTLTNELTAADDFEVVRAVVLGQSGALTCGTEESESGAVVDSDDPATGSGVGQLLSRPYRFQISSLIKTFTLNVIGSIPQPDLGRVTLTSPDGSVLELSRAGDTGVDEATEVIDSHRVTWTWYSNGRVFVEADLDQNDAGTWVVDMNFLGPSEPSVRLTTFPGFSIGLAGQPVFKEGETTSISFRLVDADGANLLPNGLDEAVLVRATIDATGSQIDGPLDLSSGQETFDGSVAIPLDSDITALVVAVTVEGVDPEGGLLEERESFAFDVAPPVGFPVPRTPSPLTIVGAETEILRISVEADPTTGGCVQIVGVDLDVPNSAPADSMQVEEYSTECVRVDAGSDGTTLLVPIAVLETSSGSFDGEVELVLESDDSAVSQRHPLAFTGRTVRPVDDVVFGLLLAVMLIVGIGLPLLVLAALKRVFGRYRQSNTLRWAEIPIVASSDHGIRPAQQGHTSIPQALSAYLDQHQGRLWLKNSSSPPSVPGYDFRIRYGWDPFASPTAYARHPGSVLVVGSKGSGKRGRPPESIGLLEFGLRGQWVVAIDGPNPDSGHIDGSAAEWAGHLLVFGGSDDHKDFDSIEHLASPQVSDELRRVATEDSTMVIGLDESEVKAPRRHRIRRRGRFRQEPTSPPAKEPSTKAGYMEFSFDDD